MIDKDVVRESVSKINNRKVAGSAGLVLEMVNLAGEKRVSMLKR